MATSHDYADSLVRLAEFIKSKSAFPLSNPRAIAVWRELLFSEKESFIGLARAIHGGTKSYDDFAGTPEITYKVELPTGEKIEFSVYRDAVCRLVKPARAAEYDCEPLLSQDEEESIA